MSDFIKARFSATFTPTGGEEVILTRHGQLMPGAVEEEWSGTSAAYDCIAHPWGLDIPTGNARMTRTWSALIKASTRAELERRLRRLEIGLNMRRHGVLLLEEAYSQGSATLHTWWRATLDHAEARPLSLDEAPPIPGAWGVLEVSYILSAPQETPPTPGGTQEEPGTQEDPGTQEEPGTQEDNPSSQYAIGHIIFANGRPNDDIGLYIGGQHITTNCGGGASQGWVDAINAANCGVTAVGASGSLFTVYLTATTPGEDGQLTLELRDNLYYDSAGGRSKSEFLSGPTLTLPS